MKIIPYPQELTLKEGFLKKPYKIKKINVNGANAEEYRLDIDTSGVVISAAAPQGFFYAQQTLRQIEEEYGDNLPFVSIRDYPIFPYRGYMLDCSRHFFSVDLIKKQIDIMALLKLNKFHWHLTDDQGWRIQIDKYPLLTEIGSKRAQTAGDGKEVSGFFTKDEIREVVAYCAERFIDVIPEIDMPGHFKAALAAYPQFSCRQQPLNVGEGFGISPDIICGGKDEVYGFCFDIIDEVAELFPYEYIHLGGDEALKLHWLQCTDCQKKMAELGLKDEEQLQGYFMSRMVEHLNKKGKTVINWNDGMLGENLSGDMIVQYWKENRSGKEAVRKESAKGRKIILSPFFSFYLDYPHGMTPLKKTYNYKMDKEIAPQVIGVEAPLWTEHVKDEETVWKQTYPRLAAVAERGWSNKQDYQSFLTRLQNFYNILDRQKISYSKTPNPFFITGKLEVLKFFRNALTKVEKGNLTAMKKTKRLIRKKYKN